MTVGNRIAFTAVADSSDGTPTTFDYFVDPVAGDDANDGLKPSTALATFSGASTAVGSAGGKRVGIMNGDHGFVSLSGAFTFETTFEAIINRGPKLSRMSATLENAVIKALSIEVPDTGTAQPNPNSAPDVLRLTDPVDVTVDDCLIGAERQLRTRWAVDTTGNKAVRVTIQNCLMDKTGGGVRFRSGATDCTVQDSELRGMSLTPLGNNGLSNTGLKYLRNVIWDFHTRTDDPEWTTGGSVGTWEAAHSSMIALRDTIDVQIEDNVAYSLSNPWIQLYQGEDVGGPQIYEYGDISIKRNLSYDIGVSFNYSLFMQAIDTDTVGPIIIENNTVVNGELSSWDAQNYTQLRERFFGQTYHPRSLGGSAYPGTSVKNNLVVGRSRFPAWSNNNVGWVQPEDSDGTDNVYVEESHNNNPQWVEDQLVAGTFVFEPMVQSNPQTGFTFQPKAGSFLATGGEGGTHIGATPPPA